MVKPHASSATPKSAHVLMISLPEQDTYAFAGAVTNMPLPHVARRCGPTDNPYERSLLEQRQPDCREVTRLCRCATDTRTTNPATAFLQAGTDPPPHSTTAAPQDDILQAPPGATSITALSFHTPPRVASKPPCVSGVTHARKGIVLIAINGGSCSREGRKGVALTTLVVVLVRLAKHPAHTSDGVRMSTACVAQQPYIDTRVTLVVRHVRSRQCCTRRLGHGHHTTKQASGRGRTRALANQANIATCILHTMF